MRGNYDEALEGLVQLDGKDPLVAAAKARCHESSGRYAEALRIVEEARKESPKSPELLALASRLHRIAGRLEEARGAAEACVAAQEDYLPGRWEEILALDALGRYEEINPKLEYFIDYYNDRQPTDSETLYFVALGGAEYARRFRSHDEFDFILNTLLVDAAKAEPGFWQASWLTGAILLEKYNKAEAVPSLKEALKLNPSATEALTSLGRAAALDWDFPNGYNFVRQALEVNPNSVEALCLAADLYVLDERLEEAAESAEKALAVNPASIEAMGRLAACRYLQQNREEAEDLERRALAVNPKPGLYYESLGGLLSQRRQFEGATAALQKAIEAAPHLAGPRNELGMLYMRLGREDEAREVFAEAFAIDPFHVRVSNMRKVLNHLEGYQVIRSPHYELWISGDQDGLLGPYMSEFLESTHEKLCRRFGYEPKGLTKIQIMKNHQWFSARVVGLPSIGTVGACTGDVVALASPQSLPKSYNWARVLTHEVTHVITLQQTNYNIPHWYTEALAVMSEGYPRPQEWNALLAERVPKRDLLNLETINHAFVRPKTPVDWQMAYCQAQQYAEYMLQRFGDDALARLLDAYSKGMPTEAAIRAVFGVSKEDFEAGYVRHLDELVAGLRTAPKRKETTLAEAERAFQDAPKDAAAAADVAHHYLRRKNNRKARELAEAARALDPAEPLAAYVLARLEWTIGKPDEAEKLLVPAHAAHPRDENLIDLLAAIQVERGRFSEAAKLYETARESDPYSKKWVEALVKMHLKTGNREALASSLETLAAMDADNIAVRKKLAQMAFEDEDWRRAAHWARETMYVAVGDVDVHRILARAARELGDPKTSMREYETIAKLSPDSLPDAIELVKAYVAAGDREKGAAALADLRRKHPREIELERLAEDVEKERPAP